MDISIDARNPNVIYAALWEAFRLEYTMSSGGPGSGLFKSTDGGETWIELTRNPGLPAGVIGRIGVAVSGADSSRVYAIVENRDGGLFRSDDGGATWALVNGGRNIRQRAFYYTHLAADPKDRDLVYVLNVGLFKSTDGGRTLTYFAFGDSHDLWIDPDDTSHILHAMDGGGAVTYDGGRTWSARDYPTPQYYHVITTKHLPYHVCGAHQDGSAVCVSSASGPADGGSRGRAAVTPPYGVGGTEPATIAPDPKDLDVFFSGGNNGLFLERLNRRTGESREVGPYPRIYSGEPSSALVERIQWTFPIVFSPADPNVLYSATQHVWKTTNAGQDWERISPDLTRHDPKTMGESGGPITHDMNGPEVYATVFAIGPGKTDAKVIWAGSDDGLCTSRADGGQHVGERHAARHARLRPRQQHRRFGVRRRLGVHRRQAAAARRLLSVHLPHARLREDVDEDRRAASRPATTCTSSARTRPGAACSTRAPSTASTCRSTTATPGNRCR